MATATTKQMTAAELLAMPGDNLRHELVKGELTTIAPAGFEHGSLAAKLFRAMGNHADANDLGEVVSTEAGFLLSRDPDTVRAPDVAFVRKTRVPSPKPKGFFDGPPDIAAEVVSPGDTPEEVDDKVGDYFDAGTEQVWVVNPRRRTVSIYLQGGSVKVLRETEMLDGGAVFPGFSVTVGDSY